MARRPRSRRALVAGFAVGSAAALSLTTLASGAPVGGGASQQNAPARLSLTLATGQVDSFGVNLNFRRGAPQSQGGSAVYPISFGGNGVKGRSGVIGSAILAGAGQITLNRSRSEASLQLQQLTVLFPEVPGAGNAAPAQAGGTPPARTTLTAPVQLSTETVDNWPFNGPQPVPKLTQADLYRCYRVTRVKPPSAGRVRLRDQFGDNTVAYGGPTEVCNPLQQNGRRSDGPPARRARDTVRHLVAYRIAGAQQPLRDVGVLSQFGPGFRPTRPGAQLLTTRRLTDLLVPSKKVQLSGPSRSLPTTSGRLLLSHFACYQATASRPLRGGPRRAVVTDQFERSRPLLAAAHAICNPAAKTLGGRTTPRRNPQTHLTSFSERNLRRRSATRTVRISNQFGTKVVTTGGSTRILVPSTKRRCARFRAQGLGIPVVATSPPGRIIARIAAIELTPYAGPLQAACPG